MRASIQWDLGRLFRILVFPLLHRDTTNVLSMPIPDTNTLLANLTENTLHDGGTIQDYTFKPRVIFNVNKEIQRLSLHSCFI
jgi:hypothetical protein